MKHRLLIAAGAIMLAPAALTVSAYRNAPAHLKASAPAGTSFFVDGKYYEVVSEENNEVLFGIDFRNDQAPYSGDVVVPATVTYGGTEYTVVEIGKFAFDEDAYALRSVTLPNTIRKIDTWSFYGSTITEIILPESLREIETNSFCEAALTSLTLPGTITTLGEDIFQSNKAMETLVVEEGITALPNGIFDGCEKLTSVSLPSTLKSIGEYAFYQNILLGSITLPEGLERIDKYAFAKCMAFTEFTVPQTVTTVGKGIICDCNAITSVTLPDAWEALPEEMFSYCVSLPAYTISDNIRTVGDKAFEMCMDLQEVTVGKNVESFGADCFYMCNALTKVTSLATTPPTGVTFPESVYATATLEVPASALDAYKAAEGWKQFTNIVGNPLSGIDEVTAAPAAIYYTLDGIKTDRPERGNIYIQRLGDKVSKIIVK